MGGLIAFRASVRALLGATCCAVFVLAVLLWARGYFAWERVVMSMAHTDPAHQPPWSGFTAYYLTNARGSVALGRFRWTGALSRAYPPGVKWDYSREKPQLPVQHLRPGDRINIQFAGFGLLYTVSQDNISRDSIFQVMLPPWAFVPAAIPPALWLRRRLNRRIRGFGVETQAAAQ